MDGAATFAIFQSALNSYNDEFEKFADCFVEKSSYAPNGLQSPIIVKISIDYNVWSTVTEWKMALKTLLDEPMQSKKDIETCVWLMIYSSLCQRHPQLKFSPQLDQVHCIIRFSNLPLNVQYKFVPFRHPVRLSLSVMRCVLSSFGDCSQLLRQTIWYCPKQCAETNNLVINAEYSIGSNDKRQLNKCPVCNETLVENEVCTIVIAIEWWRENTTFIGIVFVSIVVQHTWVAGFKFLKLKRLKLLYNTEKYIEMFE